MGYVLALLCAYTMARVFTEQSPWEIDDRSSNLLFTWCLFSFGGLALYLILSLAFNVSTPLEHHYVMLFTIPSYLLLPVLASIIRRRVIKATFLAVFWILFVLPIAASLVVSGDITSRYREDWKAAIYFLDRNADDGDTVLFHSGLTELNLLEEFRERGLLGYLRFPLEGYYLEKDLNIMTVGYPWLKGTDRYHKDLLQDALSLRNPVWTFERFGARQGGGRLAAWLAKGVSPAAVRTGKSFTTKNLEVREVMIVREGR
jgi:hypothetical protein